MTMPDTPVGAAMPSPLRRSPRRRSRWRSPIALDSIVTLLLLAGLLLIPLRTLDIAGWEVDLYALQQATGLGLVLGIVLARSRLGDIAAWLLSLVCSCFFLLFYAVGYSDGIAAGGVQLESTFLDALRLVLERCYDWLLALLTDGINTDPLVLNLIVLLLFWLLAMNAAWHVCRDDRVWRVILPLGLVVVVNVIFYSGQESLAPYLFAFMLLSLMLLVRSHLEQQGWQWSRGALRVPNRARRQFAFIGILLALASLGLAWSLPRNQLAEQLEGFQRFLASDPLQQLADTWNRLFAPLEGIGSATTDFYAADFLEPGGAISLGDEIVFTVAAPPPPSRYYWRARVYERFNGRQWSPSASLRVSDRNPPLDIAMSSELLGGRRIEIEQHFTIGSNSTRLYHAAPQPSAIDGRGRIDLAFNDPPENSSMNISVIRPLQLLRQGDRYSARSMLSTASAQELRAAPPIYPEWVASSNLYVAQPSARILDLARRIAADANANSAYDQAKAIERWLRSNIAYNERIEAPPYSQDMVEWLLFESREGYCTYSATAMIVMLRHLGIPARLAAGFSQGTFDDALGQYVVRESNAHAWVEVFFSGYGWIIFEPTPSEEPLHRGGDEDLPQADPPPSPTATPSATSSPTPSPGPSPTNDRREENQQLPAQAPTATPSPPALPSPSPSPVLLPTVEPPISPDAPPALNSLQPLLLVAMVIMGAFILLFLLLLFLVWWWEWRGLRGLSPISRAFARLERYMQLIGIRFGSAKTTLEKGSELQRRLPAAREAIRTISSLYTRERYGAPAIGEDPQLFAQNAEQAWTQTRGDILRRWLRRWLPFLRR